MRPALRKSGTSYGSGGSVAPGEGNGFRDVTGPRLSMPGEHHRR
ncbi:hypothetical protein [Paenarthrobacter sp. DKR-5]|nr:hypothetical protein [Paenarthrobacter sp. DKR-5]